MTINGSSIMASQVYAARNVQSQSGASGYATQDPGADFSAIAQQLLSTIDTNQSGSIDKAEFSDAAQSLAKNANSNNSSAIDAAFGKIDTNGDGQISSDEFMNALKQANNETQKRHHHRHRRMESNEQATADSTSSDLSAQASSRVTEMQKSLFNKILAAYGSNTATTGTTTNLTV